MHNIFLYSGRPEYFGNFLLFVGQDQLGENYLMYSRVLGVPEYFRQKKYA